jgi:hypothetical protein
MSRLPEKDDLVSEGSSGPTRATLKDGVPHYIGLAGDNLISAITCIATAGEIHSALKLHALFTFVQGFLLFGYDQGVVRASDWATISF